MKTNKRLFQASRKHASDNSLHFFYVIAESFSEAERMILEHDQNAEIGQINTVPGIILVDKEVR